MTYLGTTGPVPKPKRLRDKQYTKSFKGQSCWACGAKDGTIVGAHIRTGHEGGTGLKPDDDLTIPLCFGCHLAQENTPGSAWWVEKVLKSMARRRYKQWKDSQE